MTCQDSFHEVAFNISFWTRNISSARILFWRGVFASFFHFILNILQLKRHQRKNKFHDKNHTDLQIYLSDSVENFITAIKAHKVEIWTRK